MNRAADLLDEKGRCHECANDQIGTCDDCGGEFINSKLSECAGEGCGRAFCPECEEGNLSKNSYCADCAPDYEDDDEEDEYDEFEDDDVLEDDDDVLEDDDGFEDDVFEDDVFEDDDDNFF